MLTRFMKIILSLILCTFLLSCSNTKNNLKDSKLDSPEKLYEIGINSLQERKYKISANHFDEIEQKFPFSPLVPDAIIMQIYSHFLDRNYTASLSDIERFMLLYPYHNDVPYVLYMRALCYYTQIKPSTLDQEITELAGKYFKELMEKYPDSKYSKDAKYKLHLVQSNLASKEMKIGLYYLSNYKITSALSKFQIVVENYQNTNYIEEALYRMSESFYLLGNYNEAIKYASILHYNYPDSIWYKRSYRLLNKKIK